MAIIYSRQQEKLPHLDINQTQCSHLKCPMPSICLYFCLSSFFDWTDDSMLLLAKTAICLHGAGSLVEYSLVKPANKLHDSGSANVNIPITIIIFKICITHSVHTHKIASKQTQHLLHDMVAMMAVVVVTVSLGKIFGSKGKQLYNRQASETQSHN